VKPCHRLGTTEKRTSGAKALINPAQCGMAEAVPFVQSFSAACEARTYPPDQVTIPAGSIARDCAGNVCAISALSAISRAATGGIMCAVSAVSAISRPPNNTVWLRLQIAILPGVSLHYHENQSVARLCRQETPISPLFHQDDQILYFPALLSCLGDRLIGWLIVFRQGPIPGIGRAIFGAADERQRRSLNVEAPLTMEHCIDAICEGCFFIFYSHVSVPR
jgi:hypothetical protein